VTYVIEGEVAPLQIRYPVNIKPQTIGISIVDGIVDSYTVTGPRILQRDRLGMLITATKWEVEQFGSCPDWINEAIQKAEKFAKEQDFCGIRYL
jgi:hypothetical protein